MLPMVIPQWEVNPSAPHSVYTKAGLVTWAGIACSAPRPPTRQFSAQLETCYHVVGWFYGHGAVTSRDHDTAPGGLQSFDTRARPGQAGQSSCD